MRKIGVLQEEPARRFGDYLLTVGVDNTVEQAGSDWAVWVHDDTHLERAEQALKAFRWDASEARFLEAAQTARGIRLDRAARERRRGQLIIRPQKDWSAQTRGLVHNVGRKVRKTGKLTMALIVICIAVAVFSKVGEDWASPLLNWLYITPINFADGPLGSNGLSAVRHGQVWRLLTPIFIHFGILHIVFNMWWLSDLGSLIEQRKGMLMLGALVVVSGVVANLGQYVTSGPYFGGMSGVVYALFGYIWLKGRLSPGEGMTVSHNTVVVMLVWLVICMMGWVGPIANTAHVLGLVMGVVWAVAPYVWRKWQRIPTG